MEFSIIVPIYNVEKYLKACIDSVLNQTYGDFELILIDDGSTDSCPDICDEYKEKDSRIKVLHKKNGGLAAARQSGIKLAEGRYVLNLDADDSIELDTLTCAYKIICDNPCDIISFSYRWVENSNTVNITNDGLEEGLYDKDGIERFIYPRLLLDENMNHMSYYLSGKVIRRELLLPNQLNVNPEISLGEDLCCVFPCYLQAKSVYISKKAAYLYTKRNDSMSKAFNAKQIFLLENIINEIYAVGYKKPHDFESQISRYSTFMCFSILAAAAEGNHIESINEIKKNILSSFHTAKIKEAHFENISLKSRVSIFLMKRNCFKTVFYFLNLCKNIKKLVKKGWEN